MRRQKRALTHYRIKEKSLRRRRIASGPHVNFNARLYDPKLGRFLSVDPLLAHPGSTQAINPYSYVENNPLNKTDPTGMSSMKCTGSGSNRVCTGTVTTTPTGSHIPQTNKVTVSGGKVTTSGPGAMPGGRIATSTDGNSFMSFSVTGAIAKNAGSTGTSKVSDHTKINGQAPDSLAGNDPQATPAQISALKKMSWREAQGNLSGKETKFYMNDAGKLIESGIQTGCSGNDRCTLDNVEGATLAGHTHVYPPRLQNQRLLSRSQPCVST